LLLRVLDQLVAPFDHLTPVAAGAGILDLPALLLPALSRCPHMGTFLFLHWTTLAAFMRNITY
jgi:hypothetical protein